ncbi:MFS transporter [Listeria monocytogenes]|uniref:MFS transporter n=1 Tax=Listeria monocytogenes TaxID=1639 RepID=UPI0010B5B965|nr:MFS transporter [Listeria monocytogenes]EAC5805527.1 MFS transporter [Listeria monocytogenes]EAC9482212.1 MFS transporter [Listeria monocytogenes]EHL5826521.1 MFS transporter [Listeria monocytogenes]EKC6210738.1 MFS transporter [Listeria monocytogenes]MDA5918474.1 MFS transporter [Listeria monocytogenes]
MGNNKITEFIDNSSFSRFHITLVALGVFLITFTGYGATAYGSVIPLLFGEWTYLNADILGYIGGLSEFGSLFGALFFGMISNKTGIKKNLIIAAMIFCVATFAQAFAPSAQILAILRAIAGFGFGGVIPLVISLLQEYTPKSSKGKSIAIALCGNQFGAIIAALVAIVVTSQLQWRPVFYIGLIPIILLPLIIMLTPESTLFMAKKGDVQGIEKVLKRIDVNYAEKLNVSEVLQEISETVTTQTKKVSYSDLLKGKYLVVTLLSCLNAIMGLLFINGVIVWLPNLMVEAGFELGSSIAFTIFLCSGTVVGSVFWAAVADKKGYRILLPTIYFLGSISLLLMGIKSTIIVLYIFVTLVGFFLFAAHSLLNAFVAGHYPAELRTTAVSIPNSIGRVGGLLGSPIGGLLIANHVSVTGWFIVFAAMGFVCVLSFIVINLVTKK